jgi:hypothetical protein
MNHTIRWILASIVAVVLLAGGLLGAVAFAQTPPPQGQKPGDVFWATLASKLNVSQDVLKAAVRDSAKAVVAQSVQDGRVKQDAADKLNERIDKLPLDQVPFPIMPPRRPGPTPHASRKAKPESLEQMLYTAANVLNMNPRDLMLELQAGLTLGQIAQQKGVDPNKLKAAMLAVPYSRIDEAVKNGKLAQDKAAELKAKLEKGVDLNKRIQAPNTPPIRPHRPPRPARP